MRRRRTDHGTWFAEFGSRPQKDGFRTPHVVIGTSKADLNDAVGRAVGRAIKRGDALDWQTGSGRNVRLYRDAEPLRDRPHTTSYLYTESDGGRRVRSAPRRHANPFRSS